MKPLLQQLENESLLLLYMAGELPPSDRAELEAMLARDGGLRAQLDTLSAAEASCVAALGTLDAAQPLRSVEPATRRVARAMQQWQIDRLSRPASKPPSRSVMQIWAWSAGSAVAALLVFCIWWGFHNQPIGKEMVSTQPSPRDQVAQIRSDSSVPDADVPDSSVPPAANSNMPQQNDAPEIVTMDSTTQRLGDLERAVDEDFATATLGQ